ncbi:5-methyltetrahydropteroyltriglutamate--homocysteine S-methyltransferase [Saccharophagus degradans]|uniref:5-methyltetrahydropteroyltriglutamate--homocysteine methyltransferase n=1 Tax=Saccharophagus degradans TaxID=86304 RepID=A0AAW7X4A0_9GAMM|nr:5-methyltetrahydropteroyltriglutamate--homocysteine S-methyltransferase [Saccharophagus degradans]MDO6422214.1 5-methyltetrahydropteroyltriglutamate--homocysteine S-methyltransferase [Saccharophagus degradans]MDO6607511.1 5-methyltetrahydropteroyltriglutamate--homocysteine S-methyltransferase [Saccharophagus degradans]
MTTVHNLGFPRIGAKRELKFACEAYWRGEIDQTQLDKTAHTLRANHWQTQLDAGVEWLPVGDFSYYDHVLDTSFLVGNIPARAQADGQSKLDTYFKVARGTAKEAAGASCCGGSHAAEMTKWFDTNYHYLVPELNANTHFKLDASKLLTELEQARALTSKVKPVILGPLSYLWLAKITDGSTHKLGFLDDLITVYRELLGTLAKEAVEWVQFDEPILALDLPEQWQHAFERVYHQLQLPNLSVLLATYFGPLDTNLRLAARLPTAALHLDITRGGDDLPRVLDILSPNKILSVGVIDGRNIWKADLNKLLAQLKPVKERLGNGLWLAPSCSLLHTPVDLDSEEALDVDIKNWLAFAKQKLQELNILQRALDNGETSVAEALVQNAGAIAARKASAKVNNAKVQSLVNNISPSLSKRESPFATRIEKQQAKYNLPTLPTTTIGSFPQTSEIRKNRKAFKSGEISQQQYDRTLRAEIAHAIELQEKIGIDVLVHGEAERNDMVEYFGEQLDGYVFTQFGWVQSYGSRCVKPPIIFGDVSRPRKITVDWAEYAQSLTSKPVKGMLTGPITMLQWSFVRDDQPRKITAQQIALALRSEVNDLEAAGITIIQVDEPALREGLPLRKKDWQNYLDWAVEAFKISTAGVGDTTQIHTHMCYAEFNDIIQAIADLDADVITIETSRSNMELLSAFEQFNYPNDIGPGVYDIHSPNIPATEQVVGLIKKAAENLPLQRLWINPDCGLKTRKWEDVIPALENMVNAAKQLRAEVA